MTYQEQVALAVAIVAFIIAIACILAMIGATLYHCHTERNYKRKLRKLERKGKD